MHISELARSIALAVLLSSRLCEMLFTIAMHAAFKMGWVHVQDHRVALRSSPRPLRALIPTPAGDVAYGGQLCVCTFVLGEEINRMDLSCLGSIIRLVQAMAHFYLGAFVKFSILRG